MDATDVVRLHDAPTVRRAVGDPIERDGATVVPAGLHESVVPRLSMISYDLASLASRLEHPHRARAFDLLAELDRVVDDVRRGVLGPDPGQRRGVAGA